MRWLNDFWFRVRALFARSSMERDMRDEFAFHVEMEAKKYESEGMTPDEALRKARIKFGGEERFKEKARESWGIGALTDLGSDLRFALRQLLKNPAFSSLAALTLALGIGGTVALFSVVHGLMIRPLPIEDEERVVSFWSDYNWRGEEFDRIKGIPRHFESVAAYSNEGYTLRTEAGSSIVVATVASVELWDVIGTKPLFGRTFEVGEDRPGSEPVVVLNHGIWEREFGSDRDIVGRRINLGGIQRTVVGVMPEGFYFPTPDMEMFVPLDLDPDKRAYAGNGWLVVTGKLREGTTEAQIEEDLNAITTFLGENYTYSARWDKTRDPWVVSTREYWLGDVRPAMLLLLSAVGVLLLMACVNVTALILTKTVDRTREMSVRAALGAGRARLARQVLTESVVLGLVAGGIGMALAVGMFDLLVASLPIDPSFRETLSLNWQTLVVALALSVTTGALISLAPIRNLLQGRLSDGALTQRSDGGGAASAGRMQSTLVVAEVLLAVVLVTGASLLVRTVDRLQALDAGLEPAGVLTMGVILPSEETAEEERFLFFQELVERSRGLPTVTDAGLMNRLFLRDGGYQGSVTIHGRPDLEGVNRPNAMYRPVTPGLFDAMGIEVVQGRGIEPTDIVESPTVAVINEAFARRIWGDESPLGRTFSNGFTGGDVEIVGVVQDVAMESLVGDQPMTGFYAWNQSVPDSPFGILVLKSTGDPTALVAPVRAMIQELDNRAVIGRVDTMDDVFEVELAEPLRLRFFLGLFSLLGIVLGTVGVYGVVSYSVHRRRTEFGIRMALGAEPGLLLGTVVRQGLVPVALGIVGGTIAALFASRTLASFLFGVEPTDPVSMLAAASVLLVAGVVAAIVPAWRASSTDPAVALRAD